MKFHVQIKSEVVMSRQIDAEDLAEALAKAKAMADREDNGVKAARSWAYEYCEKARVTLVME